MKARHLVLPALVLAALAALSSCTDAIYSIIENERKVVTSTLGLTISVFGIATSAAGGPYFVAAGALFRGTFNASQTIDWYPSDTSRPLNPSGFPICNALVYYGPTATLWGGFVSTAGSAALYQSTAGLSFAGQSPVNDPAINGKQATLLQVANGHIFMGSTADTLTYELDVNMTGASPWTVQKTIPPSPNPTPITGIGFDGTRYWMASSNLVYSDASDPPTFAAAGTSTLGGLTVGSTINGVYADPNNAGRVFFATKSNGIYYTLDGGTTWKNIGADVIGNVIVSDLCVAGPADGLTADKYLVGSDGYGYYTLSVSQNSMSRFGDSTVILYIESVSRILVDGANVFAGTNMNGLWRAVFDTTVGALASGQSWVHE
jgi:hypothetical protein